MWYGWYPDKSDLSFLKLHSVYLSNKVAARAAKVWSLRVSLKRVRNARSLVVGPHIRSGETMHYCNLHTCCWTGD